MTREGCATLGPTRSSWASCSCVRPTRPRASGSWRRPETPMVRVKICGICDVSAARVASEAGADLIGFHFCDSSRRITPEEAKAIVDSLDARPQIVGVFIDEAPPVARQVAEFVGLDLLQLHGSEAPGFDAGTPVMKVLKVRDGEVPDAGGWPDPIMLDSWSHDQRGGTGRTWTW